MQTIVESVRRFLSRTIPSGVPEKHMRTVFKTKDRLSSHRKFISFSRASSIPLGPTADLKKSVVMRVGRRWVDSDISKKWRTIRPKLDSLADAIFQALALTDALYRGVTEPRTVRAARGGC